MTKQKLQAFFTPTTKVWVGLLALAIAGNVVGKILAPNGPSGGLRGFFGGVGMAVFFVLAAYLVVAAVVWAARRFRARGVTAAD